MRGAAAEGWPQGRLVLVLGGARSGKSRFACSLARQWGGERVLFVATAEACDPEMAERIRRHRAERPAAWATVEVTDLHLAQAIGGGWADQPVLVLDCLSLWVSRQLPEQPRPDQAQALWEVLQPELAAFEAEVRRRRATAIVVSNEVGWGVVPEHPSGRLFRDLLGWCNQWVAARADAVWLLVAGIPLCLKAWEQACGPGEAANVGH